MARARKMSRLMVNRWPVMSVALLAGLPLSLLWPYCKQTLPFHLASHLVSAIYEFPSDEMPRCEHFIHHTDTAGLGRPVACQVNPAQLMI